MKAILLVEARNQQRFVRSQDIRILFWEWIQKSLSFLGVKINPLYWLLSQCVRFRPCRWSVQDMSQHDGRSTIGGDITIVPNVSRPPQQVRAPHNRAVSQASSRMLKRCTTQGTLVIPHCILQSNCQLQDLERKVPNVTTVSNQWVYLEFALSGEGDGPAWSSLSLARYWSTRWIASMRRCASPRA
jgi:hypothetical protein